jgi:predicted N-formylglutamate amidohydrolase
MTAAEKQIIATSRVGAAPHENLLSEDEPAAFEVLNPDGVGNAVLVCDHASNRLPRKLGTLGLGTADLASHIAWDPGAALVARDLSDLLDAPLVLSAYSRLVIDCNRPLESPESIPPRSNAITVPGNQLLAFEDRALRIECLFKPYHRAISDTLDARDGRPSLLLSLHSFTPILSGQPRPWTIGISYGRDRRFAALMLMALKREKSIDVGDNQPYAVDDTSDYTIPHHGEARGLPHALVEIRQDGLTTPAAAAVWAERLAKTFREAETFALRLR